MSTYFASEIIAAPNREKGKRSQLFGWVLVPNPGNPDQEEVLYFPKYRDLLQAIQCLYEKEDIRYSRERGYLGYEMLWNAISAARDPRNQLEEICKQYKLPPPHFPLPIRRVA